MSDMLLFVHRGESWYLYYAIKQARAWHPKARIVMITDRPQPALRRYAEIHPISSYWSTAQAFEGVYEHFSCNEPKFERFCFQRWFVIDQFLRRHRPERAIHLDSDVLVYDNLFRDFQRPGNWDLGIVGYQGVFSMLIPKPEIVGAFCERITHLFTTEKASLAQLYREWTDKTAETAMSDMHALHTFVEANSLSTLDLGACHEGAVYDNVLRSSDGFRMRDGYKQLFWSDRQPYAERSDTGERVRLKTIHFQGPAKCKMVSAFTARDAGYFRDRLLEKLARRLRPRAPKAP